MSPKKEGLKSVISDNEEFGIELLKREDIPSPLGRGRYALVPKLTIAKVLEEALTKIAENGIGISEEACGFNLTAPATVKEAQKLGLKNLAISFFTYVRHQIEHHKLKEKVEITRREGGKKIYITGPSAD